MLIRFLAVPLFLTVTASACLNHSQGTDIDGHNTSRLGVYEIGGLRIRMETAVSEARRPIRSEEAPSTPAERLEADALDLIYTGKYTAALPLLQQAAALAPESYSIAANLGTNLELVGDNDQALRWISEAVRLNPASHRGTEWVHVLILQAKVRDAAKPGLAASNPPLIDVPARVLPETLIHAGGAARNASDIREAISYQLHERMLFVKPKDPYVADLLFALARLQANLDSVESADKALALAETYGYDDPVRIGSLRADIRRARRLSRAYDAAAWTLSLLALCGVLVFAYRRKWFFLRRKDYLAHQAARRANADTA